MVGTLGLEVGAWKELWAHAKGLERALGLGVGAWVNHSDFDLMLFGRAGPGRAQPHLSALLPVLRAIS